MNNSELYELIKFIENGTSLHIGAVFFGDERNVKCHLPFSHQIHSSVCDHFKTPSINLERCKRCRQYALKKAIKGRKPFGALCINGIYEYTHPVIFSNKVICVIFIGNILTCEGEKKLAKTKVSFPLDKLEKNITQEDCEKIASIIENYIVMLYEKYPSKKSDDNLLIENLKAYILSNLEYDLKLGDIAPLFFYNQVYLGRLFKSKTGMTINEFINQERIKRAKILLCSNLSVTEVSLKIGYNNVSYFNKVFKSLVSISPLQYKKLNKKN